MDYRISIPRGIPLSKGLDADQDGYYRSETLFIQLNFTSTPVTGGSSGSWRTGTMYNELRSRGA